MGIDSFTLFAQLVNLCVLVWLLKHFLYQPVLKIIARRSQEIESAHQSSLLLQKETEEKSKKLEREKKEFEKNLNLQQKNFEKELSDKKKKEIEKLKNEIGQKRKIFLNELNAEKEHFKIETIQFMTKDLTQSIEKILTDFAKTTPLEQILDLFIEKFHSLRKSEIIKLNNTLKKQNVIYINSSDTLTQKQQEKIIFCLKKDLIFPQKCKIVFKTSPALIQGVEMIIDSLSVQWSVKGYMDEFQENIDKHLNQVF